MKPKTQSGKTAAKGKAKLQAIQKQAASQRGTRKARS